jgi:hypothetical protein
VPTLRLTTEEQIEVIRPILELQKTRRIGCFAVANIGFDRHGETVIELTVVALPWPDAVKICRQTRKLAEKEKSAGGIKPALPETKLTGPHPARAGQPTLITTKV